MLNRARRNIFRSALHGIPDVWGQRGDDVSQNMKMRLRGAGWSKRPVSSEFCQSFPDRPGYVGRAGWSRRILCADASTGCHLAASHIRLIAGGVCDFDRDAAPEWGLVLRGQARLTVHPPAQSAITDDLEAGDIWTVPSAHSCEIQGLFPNGVEFLSLRDTPDGRRQDLTKAGFALRPFPVTSTRDRRAPEPLVHRSGVSAPIETPWGHITIVDSEAFPACERFSVAVVEIRPGAMRDLHWHPNGAEWFYVLKGAGRMTVCQPDANWHIFDCRSGDVGHVPFGCGHFMENPGDTPIRFLEVFRSDHYADVSLTQWLALAPVTQVAAHLNLAPRVVEKLARRQRP